MEPNIKNALVSFALIFSTIAAFSQSNKETFLGKWELKKVTSPDGRSLYSPAMCQKEFKADNTFANFQFRGGDWIITHNGKYLVNDNEYYTEFIANEANGMIYALTGKTYKIKYMFSEDKKTLTILGSVDGKNGGPGTSYIEVWKKIEELKTAT
jgi:hypothetical protein